MGSIDLSITPHVKSSEKNQLLEKLAISIPNILKLK